MAQMGYLVPEGEAFYSNNWCAVIDSNRNIDAAWEYARKIGLPVFVKPNSKSQGSGVAKVYDKREFYQAVRSVFNDSQDRVVLVQKPIDGGDFRIVVVDGEVISAYRRLPLSVVGDGNSPIISLLGQKQEQFTKNGRDTKIPTDDKRITPCLKRMKMNLQTVLEEGQRVKLLDNANLSTGGDAVDVTDSIHEGYKKLAIDLTRDMGLRYSGVDIITTDPIELPPKKCSGRLSGNNSEKVTKIEKIYLNSGRAFQWFYCARPKTANFYPISPIYSPELGNPCL